MSKEEREMTGAEHEECPCCGAPDGYECADECGEKEEQS